MSTSREGPQWLPLFLDKKLDDLPLPLYCSDLADGTIIHLNRACEKVLGATMKEIRDKKLTGNSFYVDTGVRNQWSQSLLHSTGDLLKGFQFQLLRPLDLNNLEPLFVLDYARKAEQKTGREIAVGFLIEATKETMKQELDEQRFHVLRQILDEQFINFGVHVVDGNGCVSWMNRKEMTLLSVSEAWLKKPTRVAELSETEKEPRHKRVLLKLKGSYPLTRGGHRTFVEQKNAPGAPNKAYPVHIRDYGIENPKGLSNRYAELYTVVRQESIEDDIRDIFDRFGIHNPHLKQLKIRGFTKVQREFACEFTKAVECQKGESSKELVFVDVNEPFLTELGKVAKDVIGKPDREIFPKHAAEYALADSVVLGNAGPDSRDERVELHPSPDGQADIEVQVLKLPIRMEGATLPVGVRCFYWPAENSGELFSQLKKLHDAKAILDNAPVAVFQKDADHRFTYANEQFRKDINEAAKGYPGLDQISHIDEIIGKTYSEILPPSDWTERYKKVDIEILRRKTSGEGWSNEAVSEGLVGNLVVQIRKTPIAVNGEIIGVQGVFYKLYDWGVPRQRISVNLSKKEVHIVGEPDPIKIDRSKPWELMDYLCQHLNEKAPRTYQAIYDALSENPDPEADSVGLVQGWASGLSAELVKLPKLEHLVTVENVRGQGYRLEFLNSGGTEKPKGGRKPGGAAPA